jgi:hypothetical protein
MAFALVLLGTPRIGLGQEGDLAEAVARLLQVRGTILDDATGEPVRNAIVDFTPAVATESGPPGAIIAGTGSFQVELPTGVWTIRVEALGYLDAVVELTVGSAEVAPLEISLRRLFLSEEVSVVAEAEGSPRPSSVVIQPRDVFEVAGSLDNIFRTLQLLPGVATPEDFGGRLAVRGGGPDQNLTIMDGVEIHNPYRIFGLISAFNPETVDRFDLTAGGFSAAYGDRLSSLLVVDNRAGKPALGGMASMSVTDANLLMEGALPGRQGNSWLVTARRTYYDLVASKFSDNDFPAFRDVQGRFDIGVGPGRLTVEGITSREGADLTFDDEMQGDSANAIADASNDLVALRYGTALGSRASSLTTLSWYRNSEFLDFDGTFRNESRRSNVPDDASFDASNVIFAREVAVEDFAARQQFTLAVADNHFFDFGFEIHGITSATRFKSEGDRNDQATNGSSIRGGAGLPDEIDSSLTGTRGGIWFEDTINVDRRLAVVPGVRLDWNTANGDATVGPRLALYWQANNTTLFKAAGGLFSQSPGYEKLQSADYFIDLSDARGRGIRSQAATHAILGVEHNLGAGFVVSVEGYYKKYQDLIVGQLETEAARQARVDRYDFPEELQGSVPTAPIITSNPSNAGSGEAYGLDVFLTKRPTGPTGMHGWLAYTLGSSQQDAYGRRYPFDYDRRHALNVVANYRFSPRWELGTTARWATGFPRTAPLGLRVAATEDPSHDPDDPTPPALIPAVDAMGNLIYAVDYGDTNNLNDARLPYYARLDARVTFRPGGPTGSWEVYLEVLNVLNRANASRLEPTLLYNPVGDLPRLVETPESALPRIPSFGVRFRF